MINSRSTRPIQMRYWVPSPILVVWNNFAVVAISPACQLFPGNWHSSHPQLFCKQQCLGKWHHVIARFAVTFYVSCCAVVFFLSEFLRYVLVDFLSFCSNLNWAVSPWFQRNHINSFLSPRHWWRLEKSLQYLLCYCFLRWNIDCKRSFSRLEAWSKVYWWHPISILAQCC